MNTQKSAKKTYTSPILNNYGEVKKVTASGSKNTTESGHGNSPGNGPTFRT